MKAADYRLIYVIGIAIIISLNVTWISYGLYVGQQLPTVTLSDLRRSPAGGGSAALCPGDELGYQFTLHLSRPGEITITSSVQHVHIHPDGEQQLHTHYIASEEFQSEQAGEFMLTRRYVLPQQMTDPFSGALTAWDAGQYNWRITARPVGISLRGDTLSLPFEIAEGCKP